LKGWQQAVSLLLRFLAAEQARHYTRDTFPIPGFHRKLAAACIGQVVKPGFAIVL
jgi:hypothetical protein